MHVIDAALLYARMGMKVFPVHGVNSHGECTCYKGSECIDPGKHPIEKGWKDKATADEAKIQEEFTKYSFANIGILTGKESGITVLDVDGEAGMETLSKFNLPHTPMSITGSGGQHYLFKYVKLKNAVKFAPGLDIRSDGGLIVAPPSLHKCLKRYAWSVDHDIEETQIAEFPKDLLKLAQEKEKKKAEDIPDAIYEGEGRNQQLFSIGGSLRNRCKTESVLYSSLSGVNQEICKPPLPDDELRGIVKKLMQYTPKELRYGAGAPAEVLAEKPEASDGEDFEPVHIADYFLKSNSYTVKKWRKDLYIYEEDHYKIYSDDFFESILQSWMKRDARFIKYIGKTKVQQIIKCFNQLDYIVDDDFEMNIRPGYIPLRNGIFNVEKYLEEKDPMEPHSDEFLCTYALPFDYDPKARCPIFDKIRIDILGNQKNAAVWDEVLGYHLYQIDKLENFFILYGEGGNGKSVLLTILACLLGEENVSSVSLESLTNQSFALSETLGKLANIIPELPHIDRANEAIIKAFVTREIITFDRKWKPAISTRPTAVLTMATNTLPQFQDKSDGLWRRMVLFDISHKVEETKKDRRLIDPKFWSKSGELPGIFNRALLGLSRIRARGKIDETDAMKERKEEYREELNAVLRFLKDNCTYAPGEDTPTSWLYACYKTATKNEGFRYQMAQPSFVRQVRIECERNNLPYVLSDKNMRVSDYSGRVFHNMRINEFVLRRSVK